MLFQLLTVSSAGMMRGVEGARMGVGYEEDSPKEAVTAILQEVCPKDKDAQCPQWAAWCDGNKPWGSYTQSQIKSWMQVISILSSSLSSPFVAG